jgi:hypothetical protein
MVGFSHIISLITLSEYVAASSHNMAQPPQRSRSQTRAAARRLQSTGHAGPPGGESAPFDFLAQVPSPVLSGGRSEQPQQQDIVCRLSLFRCFLITYGGPSTLSDTCASPRLRRRLRFVCFLGASPFPCHGQRTVRSAAGCSASFISLFYVSQLIMAVPQPSQTATPHQGSDLFAFLEQVPSPAMGGGWSEQQQDAVRHLSLFSLCPN